MKATYILARGKRSIMKISSAALLAACLLLSGASAGLLPQKEGIQTLVLLDDWATIETHSVFFDSLRKDGHSLLFETANPPPPIKYYESYFYDNIIFMAPAAKGKRYLMILIVSITRLEEPNCNQRPDRVP